MPPPPAPSMPPPPPPSFSIAPPSPPRQDEPASDLHIAILPDATPLGDMAPPPRTTKKPSFGIQPGGEDESQLGQLGSDGHLGSNGETGQKKNVKAKGKGGKVALGPGFSALDWARLTSSGRDLRGPGGPFPKRVTMDELKQVGLGIIPYLLTLSRQCPPSMARMSVLVRAHRPTAHITDRCMVSIQWKSLQYHSISSVSSWRPGRTHAGGRSRRDTVVQ